jgi:hypothetical protein
MAHGSRQEDAGRHDLGPLAGSQKKQIADLVRGMEWSAQ